VKIKPTTIAAFALLALAIWNPKIPTFSVKPMTAVSRVIVVCESAESTPAVSNITGGATARSLKAAGKWKLWDKDSIPESARKLIDPAKDGPWCVVVHGEAATHSGPLPDTEEAFAALVQSQGGI
jgi:hypothetical protein